MATIDKGFVVGDWCVPEKSNSWAKTKEPCQVIGEDGRYTMEIRLPNGETEFVHPYRWEKCEAGNPVISSPTATIPAWVLKELLHYAKPALEAECDALGKAGHLASEQRQSEIEAVDLAEAELNRVAKQRGGAYN